MFSFKKMDDTVTLISWSVFSQSLLFIFSSIGALELLLCESRAAESLCSSDGSDCIFEVNLQGDPGNVQGEYFPYHPLGQNVFMYLW